MSKKSERNTPNSISYQVSEELYRALFEQAADGIFVADDYGRYIDVNRHGCEMLGYSRDELLALSMRDLIPDENLARDPLKLDALRDGKTLLSERHLRCKDGRLLPVEISARMLTNGHFLGLVRDISQRKQAEDALRASEERLQLALDAGQMGEWEWNIVTGEVVWSDQCLALYGLPPETPMSYERFLQALHPDDRERINAALSQAVADCANYDEQKRSIWPDGSIHWTASRGQVLCDTTGQAMRMVGVTFDITQWKEAEEKVQQSAEELQHVMASVSDFLWSGEVDEEGKWSYHYYSPVVETITGRPPAFYMADPQNWLDIIHPEDRTRNHEAFQRMVKGQSDREDEEYRVVHPDGTIRWVRDCATVTRMGSNRIRINGVGSDITERKQAEAARQKQHQELEAFFSQTIDGCFFMMLDDPVRWDKTSDQEEVLDYVFAHQRITRVNDAMLAQYGAIRDQMLHLTPADFFKHDLSQGRNLWRQLFDAGKICLESDERKLDGTAMWIEGEYILLYDLEGRITGHFGIQRDITHRKQLQKALREAHREYASLVNSVDGIVWEADARTFQFSLVSQQAERLLGYPVEQWLSEPTFWQDHIHPDDQEWVVDYCSQSTREKRPHDFEYRMVAADGRVVWLHDRVTVVVENEQPVRLQGLMVDVTERKRIEEERRASEARFRTFVNHATDAFFLHDAWGTILDVNQQACESLGYAREELIRMTPHDFDVDNNQSVMDQMKARLDAGEVITFDTRHRRKDQTVFPVELRVRPFWQGEKRFAVSLARDITERRRADAALRASEERYRALYQDNPSMFFTLDSNGVILSVNAFGASQLGYTIDELLGQSVLKVFYEDDRTVVTTQLQQCVKIPGQIHQWQFRKVRKDGSLLWVEEYARAVTDASGAIQVLVVCQDMTGRKQAELEREKLLDQIQGQAQQVQKIIDTVPQGVLLLNKDQSITLTNPLARQYLKLLAPDHENGQVTQLGQRALNELLSPPPAGLWHEISVDDRIFEIIARPVENGHDNGGWVLVLRDVTQDRDRQQRIQQQERLATVGQLAAGIAHDFNNILATMTLLPELILRTVELPSRAEERLHTIITQAHRAQDLIQQILDFSRQSVLKQQLLDLGPFMKELIRLFERTIPEHIQISLHYGEADYFIQADISRIQQVMMNLVVNARDAMPEGGQLQISLDYVQIGEEESVPVPDMPAGEWITIQVSDTGSGIPQEVLAHVFEPFFTTKEVGKGTGLGLAQVYGIVQQHEGYIDVTSQVGTGTTFVLYFPVFATPESETDTPEKILLHHGQRQTVLLVEDDATTRQTLADSLALLNYRVQEATNGQEALTMLTNATDTIACVLSDVVMPEMGGIALLRALREKDVMIPVILISGHPLDTDKVNPQSLDLAGWLTKPLDLSSLSRLLAQILNTSQSET